MENFGISVIMNSINEDETHFHESVDSILSQQIVDVHLILSTVTGDPSIERISRHKGSIDIFITDKEKHPGKSSDGSFLQLNNALHLVRSEWFTFASSNDILFPNKYFSEIKACYDAGSLVCYSDLMIVDHELNFRENTTNIEYSHEKHLESNFIPDQSVMNFKELKHLLPFRTLWLNCGFWDFWLRAYEEKGNIFTYFPEPLRQYRLCNDSMHIVRTSFPEQVKKYNEDRQSLVDHYKAKI